MAVGLGRQGVRAVAAGPQRQRRGADPPEPCMEQNPQRKSQHGLGVKALVQTQNQGSWHIPRSSEELLPPTPGSDIPYLFPLRAMG